jgi:hypothetical protein
MFGPSVYQYVDEQQDAAREEKERNEEAIGAEVQALVRNAGNGILWQVYTAKRKVRPSPAAFWTFIARVTPE